MIFICKQMRDTELFSPGQFLPTEADRNKNNEQARATLCCKVDEA